MSKKNKRERAGGTYIIFYHPTEAISRIGTDDVSDIKKYGNYRFFGKVIEDRGYEYLVRCKYRFPNMTSIKREKMSVPKGWNIVKVFEY
jgi:hypothetical protein